MPTSPPLPPSPPPLVPGGTIVSVPLPPPPAFVPHTLFSIPETGDPVVWASRVGPDAGERSVDGREGYTAEWLAWCNRPDASVYEVARSARMPVRGTPLYTYRPGNGGYAADPDDRQYYQWNLITDTLAVANRTFRQNPAEPRLWNVTIQYEGVTDPTSQPAEVGSESVEYQTNENVDVFGRFVENSAHDAIMGGMPVDRTYKVLRITRSIPYRLWNMEIGTRFENTLNKVPFVLSRQILADGGLDRQVVLPPGTVRIKRIVEAEVIRTPHPVATDRKYFWRVTADLHIDRRTVPMPDGSQQPTLHRYAYADTGFRELNDAGVPVPIYQGAQAAHEPQFLDGRGRAMTQQPPPGRRSAAPLGEPDTYTTPKDTPLTVPAPGVLANDAPGSTAVPDTGPQHGTLTLAANGGFTYTPAAGFFGWDQFSYRPQVGAAVGTPVSVAVWVRSEVVPVWLFRDRYEYADWTPIQQLLIDW